MLNLAAIVIAAGLVLGAITELNGNTGYEGQPGNQSNGQHGGNGTPPGLRGYEGQPGNQGG